MPSRQEIVDEARKYLGTRWLHQGRAKTGIDCCGLVIRVGNDLGMITYDTVGYSRRTSGDKFLKHFTDAGMYVVDYEDAKPGDVLITSDHSFPCHCGFLTEKGGAPHFLHAFAGKRRVVEQEVEPWLRKLVAVVRFPGVDE